MQYIPGDFKLFSNEERIYAMRWHCQKLQAACSQKLFEEFGDWHSAMTEIEELSKKITRAMQVPMFDKDEYFTIAKKFNSEPAYKAEIEQKIAGTWVPPEKPKKAQKTKEPKASESTEITETKDNSDE